MQAVERASTRPSTRGRWTRRHVAHVSSSRRGLATERAVPKTLDVARGALAVANSRVFVSIGARGEERLEPRSECARSHIRSAFELAGTIAPAAARGSQVLRELEATPIRRRPRARFDLSTSYGDLGLGFFRPAVSEASRVTCARSDEPVAGLPRLLAPFEWRATRSRTSTAGRFCVERFPTTPYA